MVWPFGDDWTPRSDLSMVRKCNAHLVVYLLGCSHEKADLVGNHTYYYY